MQLNMQNSVSLDQRPPNSAVEVLQCSFKIEAYCNCTASVPKFSYNSTRSSSLQFLYNQGKIIYGGRR